MALKKGSASREDKMQICSKCRSLKNSHNHQTKLVRKMLFADDNALSHSSADMQNIIDKFAKAVTQFSLKINISFQCFYYLNLTSSLSMTSH